jgi:hypothetical protein
VGSQVKVGFHRIRGNLSQVRTRDSSRVPLDKGKL